MAIAVNLNGTTGTGITYATSPTGVRLFSGATIDGTSGDNNSIDVISVKIANFTPSMSLGLGIAWSGSVNYNTSTGVLTLTGSGDKTDITWQNVLQNVVFNDTSGTPVDPVAITVTAVNTGGGGGSGSDIQYLHLDVPPNATSHTNADEFTSSAYNLSAGTDGWQTNWSESGDPSSNAATTGDILVSGGQLRLTDSDEGLEYIQREASAGLANASRATLTFTYTSGTSRSDETTKVEISTDGTNWTQLGSSFGASGADGAFSADITDYTSSHTYVRFSASTNLENGEYIYIDNLSLSYVVPDSTALPTQTVDWVSNPHFVFSSAHGNQIHVSDVNDADLTVTLTVEHGTLTLSGVTGLTVLNNGSSTVTLSGSIANINNALNGLDYQTSSTNLVAGNVDDTLTITTSDGHTGGTDTDTVQIDCICFYPGTMVRTPDGEVAVETLKPGDLVKSSDGRTLPVRWLGRQTISMTFADPLRVLPIRIRAGALATNVPSRDLLVSPDHALLVNGSLIQAGALVNDSSIVRERNVPAVFTYYHVEVDDHSLILAENTPAETFVDNVDRMGFDNWAEYEALYPEGKSITELPYPRAKSRRQVPVNTRVMLAARAHEIGAVEATVGAVA